MHGEDNKIVTKIFVFNVNIWKEAQILKYKNNFKETVR